MILWLKQNEILKWGLVGEEDIEINGLLKSLFFLLLYSILGLMPALTIAVALVHHLVTLCFLPWSHFHVGHLGAMIAADCIEAIWLEIISCSHNCSDLLWCKMERKESTIFSFYVKEKLCSHFGPILGSISTSILKGY